MTKTLLLLIILMTTTYANADRYVCGVRRSSALRCGGADFGTFIAPLEFETDVLSSGETLSNYSGAALNPSSINAPCEEFGTTHKKIPMYMYSVAKIQGDKLELKVIASIIESGVMSNVTIHSHSAPIGTVVISTPVFTDRVVGEVSVSYECQRLGAEL